jgi:hypothetical protein
MAFFTKHPVIKTDAELEDEKVGLAKAAAATSTFQSGDDGSADCGGAAMQANCGKAHAAQADLHDQINGAMTKGGMQGPAQDHAVLAGAHKQAASYFGEASKATLAGDTKTAGEYVKSARGWANTADKNTKAL